MRLGMIDSGIGPGGDGPRLARFHSPLGDVPLDRLGHGRALLATLGLYLPPARLELSLYKLFETRLTADAEALARAFEWQAEAPPAWLLCSLGLPRPDARLRAAVARLQAAGTRIVAASPRFGAPSYPAAWPGVVAVSGAAGLAPGPPHQGRDGRWYACVWAAHGHQGQDVASWQPWSTGPPPPGTPPALGGASFAAAHALGYWLAGSAEGPATPEADAGTVEARAADSTAADSTAGSSGQSG